MEHTIERETGVSGQTLFLNRLNRFTGCAEGGCPFLANCTSNPYFNGCPRDSLDPQGTTIDPKWFDAYNPPEFQTIGHNTILDQTFNKVADLLAGVSNALDLSATMISFGTSTAATTSNQTQLTTEVGRKTFVDRKRTTTGKVVFYWFLTTSEGVAALREWGFLANTPSASLGTGTLINRFLDSKDKTADDTLTGKYSITIANP